MEYQINLILIALKRMNGKKTNGKLIETPLPPGEQINET